MKVISRSLILWNIILFAVLSIVFFHVSGSHVLNLSAFTFEFYNQAKSLYIIISVLAGFLFLSAFFVVRSSKLFFALLVLSVSSVVIMQLSDDFSKLILVILFVYLVVSYYYYQFLGVEVNQSCYIKNFSDDYLFEPMLHRINVNLEWNEESAEGFLTNWDENSCFVKLNENKRLPSYVKIKVYINDEVFEDSAKVVSRLGNGRGYGLKFKYKKSKQAWAEFINYSNEMGYLPEIIQ